MNNLWLIGHVCLSNGYRSCEECVFCNVEDIDVVIDWFSAVIWDTTRINNSPIGCTSESACPAESVDQVVRSARAFIGFLWIGVGHNPGRESSESATFGDLP